MSDALPALVPGPPATLCVALRAGLINSVIAPRGNPPPIDSSRKGKPVLKHFVVVHEG